MSVERVSQIENEALYGLLAMAEHFMSANPQRISEALQCWIASLSLSPPAASLRSLTCCKIGLTLYHHTSNIEEAKAYLNQAKITEQGMEPSDATFEAHCLLARIYCDQNLPQQARVVLKGLLDHSLRYPYWHLRFLFQLADVSVCERDSQGVIAHLSKASDYAALIKADYPRLLSLLSQGAYQLTVGKYAEGAQVLNQCGQLLEGYSGPRGPSLKAFYLVIQVTHLLWAGQPKSAKPHLRQLQHCIKEIDSEALLSSGHSAVPLNVESFEWLSKQQLYALIYLVCMMYNLQAGNTEKVISYGEKASAVMAQQLGSGVEGNPSPKVRESSMMKVIKAYVLEHLMAVKLMQGRYSEVSPLMEEVLCVCYGHSKLVYSHRALIHLFLGFYAYHNDVLDRAAAQFSCALQHTNVAELKTFITLNLALTYVRMGEEKEHDLAAVMETLRPEAVNPVCQGLRAAVMYMNGLHAYLTLKINDAKHCLREALVLTNSNDLHKLTACCLVLLGQIYFALGNREAAYNMANTSHQLANKMPDTALQSWSLGLLGYLEQENGTQSYWGQLDALKQQMVTERNKAANTAQYQLIQWAVGEWPVCVRQGSSEQKEQDRASLSAPYKGLIPFGSSVSLSPVTSPQLRQPALHHAIPPKIELNHPKGKTFSHLPLQLSPTNSTGLAALQPLHASTRPSVSGRQASFMVADGRGSEGAQSASSQGKDVSTTVALPVKPPSSNGVQQKKQTSPHPTPGPLSPPSRNLPNHSSPQRSEAVAQAIPSGAVYGWPPLQPHPQPHPQHGSPVAGGHLQPTQPLPPNVYALQQYQQQMWLQQQLAQQQQVVRQTQQQQLVRQAQQQQLTHQAQQQQQLHQAQQQQQQRTHQVQQQLHQAQQQQLHQAQQQHLHQAQQQQKQLHQAQQQQLAHQAQHLQRASEQAQKQQLGRQAQQQASKQQLASWPPLVSALPTSPPSASSQRRTHAVIPSLQPQTALILGASSHVGSPVSVSQLQGRTAQQQQQQQLYTSQPYFHQPLGRLQLPPGYRIQPPP